MSENDPLDYTMRDFHKLAQDMGGMAYAFGRDEAGEPVFGIAAAGTPDAMRRLEKFTSRGMDLPHIVCLCGSTRFYEAFQRANYEETMKGNIVLSVGFYMHTPQTVHGESLGCTPEQKIEMDELHLRKIDLADEVLVLNVGRYIGQSTENEIRYALQQEIPVRYLEEPNEPFTDEEWDAMDPEEQEAWRDEARLDGQG